jgi:hypothetical protein
MRARFERSRGLWFGLASALLLGALTAGVGPALAQAAKTCNHEGKVYQAGEKLMISGKLMSCDGATGTWVPAPKS